MQEVPIGSPRRDLHSLEIKDFICSCQKFESNHPRKSPQSITLLADLRKNLHKLSEIYEKCARRNQKVVKLNNNLVASKLEFEKIQKQKIESDQYFEGVFDKFAIDDREYCEQKKLLTKLSEDCEKMKKKLDKKRYVIEEKKCKTDNGIKKIEALKTKIEASIMTMVDENTETKELYNECFCKAQCP